MFEQILLAVDGSEHALKAAKLAGDLARAVNAAHLRIVTAYDPIPSYLGEPNFQHVIDAGLREANDRVDKARNAAGKVPAEVHTEFIAGDPAEVIVNVATTRHCCVIVMGSRGLGRLAGLVLGSTSQKVVSHAPCPVLIAR
jgi:nucleotide-binding universal stress UspA family protein